MRTWFRAPLAFALVVLSWSHLSAQAPPAAKPQFLDQQPELNIKAENAVKAYLKGTAATGEPNGATVLSQVCRKYMSEFTEVYDSKVPKFQNTRRKIADLIAIATNAEARTALIKELNTVAVSYAGNNQLHAAGRINAIYLLGDLDESVDAKAGTRKPYSQATLALMQIVSAQNLPPYLKVAGLSALERHVRDGHKAWPEAAKGRVRNAILPYVTTKPKHDSERQVNTWMARRALDILKTMDANDAIDAALGYFADPKELPSLRTSSLEYLVTRDFAKLDASQRKLYVLGLVHYLRTQSTDWYQLEGDKSKRKSGAMGGDMGGGSMGGMSGGMGGSGMGEGGDGGGMSGGFGEGGSGGGMAGGMGGGFGGEGGGASTSKPKAKDVQDWQTRSARNHLNEFTQLVHRALDGKRTSNEPANTVSKLHLTKEDVAFEEDYKLAKLIQLVDDFQKVINDINKVRTVATLMTNSKQPIEEIMDYSKKLPGFLEKYPELKSDEDKLQEAEQPKPEDGSKPDDGKKDDGKSDDGKSEDPGKPDGESGDKPKP